MGKQTGTQGLATEWNPVVTSIGLVPKLILVPLAAEALYLLGPKALWIPAVALFGRDRVHGGRPRPGRLRGADPP
jgi:hypothetical protein